jgi:isoamylase
MHLLAANGDEPIYMIANAHWEARAFDLPKPWPQGSWRRFVDTSLPPGEDALEPGAETPVAAGRYTAGPRSVVVLVGR